MRWRVMTPDCRFPIDLPNKRYLPPGTIFEAPEETIEPYRSLVERYYGDAPVAPENIVSPLTPHVAPLQQKPTTKSPWGNANEARAKRFAEEKAKAAEKASKEKKSEEPEEAEEEIAEDAKPISPLDKIRKRAQAASHKEAYQVAPHDRAME